MWILLAMIPPHHFQCILTDLHQGQKTFQFHEKKNLNFFFHVFFFRAEMRPMGADRRIQVKI